MMVATLTHIIGRGQSGTTHWRTGFHTVMLMPTGGFRKRHSGCIGFQMHVKRIGGVRRTGAIVIHAPASMRNPPMLGTPWACVDQPAAKSHNNTELAARVHAARSLHRAKPLGRNDLAIRAAYHTVQRVPHSGHTSVARPRAS